MTDKKFLSEEELEQQERMFKSAERIATVIHRNPLDLFQSEEDALRSSPQLRAMVETLLSMKIEKSRNYTINVQASWEIQDEGIIRHGTFKMNSSFSEGLLEVKEYLNE